MYTYRKRRRRRMRQKCFQLVNSAFTQMLFLVCNLLLLAVPPIDNYALTD